MRYGTTKYVLNDYKILQIICAALLQNKSLFNQPVKYWTLIVHFFFDSPFEFVQSGSSAA